MDVRSAADDEVISLDELPGWPKAANFSIYSGFLNVENTSKEIHYVFLESMTNGTDDPLVVWFNGGPGCSSMLGLLQETGPYVLEEGATQYTENPWSWNKETHILYIEQPAGVGYSTCDQEARPEDCAHTDMSSAEDNLKVLLAWFDRFSERPFKQNRVFIAGESYAGVYVPLLSWQISEWNKNQSSNADTINLAGFLVGNGVTNWTYDTAPATVDVAYYRSLMSSADWLAMQRLQCNVSGVPLGDYSHATAECMGHLASMYAGIEDLDVYNIYGRCWGVNASANATNWTAAARSQLYGKTVINGEEKEYRKFMTAQEYTPWVKRARKASDGNDTDYGVPRCIYALPAAEHLNSEKVRAQLNINNSQVWRMCATNESTFSYTKNPRASQWAYEALKG
jgi:serine carboxypeptidase-like clade 2